MKSGIEMEESLAFAKDPGIVPSAVVPVRRVSADAGDNELALVIAAQAGEASAFETLVTRYEKRLYRLAWNITQNRPDAEDVVQDAFLKAFEHLGSFQGNSRFYTWLVRIAVNQALMKLRKRRHREISLDEPLETEESFMPREIEDWGPTPEERFEQTQLSKILTEAIADLDFRLRAVFQLRDVEGFSTEQTAETLGLTIAATKTRLLRARLKLRDKLQKHFRSRVSHKDAQFISWIQSLGMDQPRMRTARI
ncbi:MAG: RNA polymerase sigma factor [Candidatus Acidiferrales bacterium]